MIATKKMKEDSRLFADVLELPLAIVNHLRREGIHTLGQLLARTEDDLLALRRFGPVKLAAVRDQLAAHGWALGAVEAATEPRCAAVESDREPRSIERGARPNFKIGATRRIHADGEPCDDVHPCPVPHWWGTGCTCGWTVRSRAKRYVKEARREHGAEHGRRNEGASW